MCQPFSLMVEIRHPSEHLKPDPPKRCALRCGCKSQHCCLFVSMCQCHQDKFRGLEREHSLKTLFFHPKHWSEKTMSVTPIFNKYKMHNLTQQCIKLLHHKLGQTTISTAITPITNHSANSNIMHGLCKTSNPVLHTVEHYQRNTYT